MTDPTRKNIINGNHIPDNIVNKFIELGAAKDSDQIEHFLSRVRKYHWTNTRVGTWRNTALNLSCYNLKHLIKGQALAEKHFKWTGGSAASVIHTFRFFSKRFPTKADGLADWILHITSNRYLPYGWDNLGATSLFQYQALKKAKDEKYSKHLLRQQQEQELALKRKSAEKSQRELANKARGEERQRFLENLSQKSLEDQLWQLAHDKLFPVTYYPTNLASIPFEQIESLEIRLQKALMEKLSIKCKGPWGKFKKRLKASLSGN